jgi:hypothetical protein
LSSAIKMMKCWANAIKVMKYWANAIKMTQIGENYCMDATLETAVF